MLKATKKVYMSILAILLVFITVVATTFAWVGILTYAQTDSFDLNLKTQKLNSDYYLSISGTGNTNDFGETVNDIILKKQILSNMGIMYDSSVTDNQVDMIFNKYCKLNPVTTTEYEILLDNFHELDYGSKQVIKDTKSTSYMKFDIYLSLEHRDGDEAITSSVNFNTDLVLADIANSLMGDVLSNKVMNEFSYPSNDNSITSLTTIKESDILNIDISSASRLAFAIYEPIDRISDYESNTQPSKLLIYEGGTQNPTYNSVTNLYSFGGILPEEYNLALFEHKTMYKIASDKLNVPLTHINRPDKELIEENRELFDDSFGFGIENGIKKKCKITIYFWFEGWDADCFNIINGGKVKINLNFSTGSLLM